MLRNLFLAALILTLPADALAASPFDTGAFSFAPASSTNVYLIGGEVRVATTTAADLSSLAGSLTVAAPVSGDALLAGGRVDVQRPVAGDLRAFGGNITVEDTVGSDAVLVGGAVTVNGRAKNVLIGGGSVSMTDGADGSVTIYGANVELGGVFASDVQVVASDHVTLLPGTVISGSLKYNAPQEASIPESAQVAGGVVYTGSSTFLPTNKEAQTFAAAGSGVFFIVSIIAGFIAAGLLAGVFPEFAQRIADATLARTTRRFVLLALLGFATLVAMPIFILLLVLSFVGIGVAVLLGAFYFLLLVLSYIYAAVIAGSALARGVFKRRTVFWRDAVFGVLVLRLIGVVPGIGPLVYLILISVAAGALIAVSFRFAFKREEAELA